jgi:hypothetical protein
MVKRKKMVVEYGIRVPQLKRRTDGRFSVRFTENGARKDIYFSGSEDEVQRQYRNWKWRFLLDRQKHPPPLRARTTDRVPSSNDSLLKLMDDFSTAVSAQSEQNQMRHRQRGRHGKYDKNAYALKNLIRLIAPLLRRKPKPSFDDLNRDQAATLEPNLLTLGKLGRTASRQTVEDALRMMLRFGKWAETNKGLDARQTRGLAEALRKTSTFLGLTKSRRKGINDLPTVEEIRKAATEANPLIGLIMLIQLENVARPNEVLCLKREYLDFNPRQSPASELGHTELNFQVPHKTDYRDEGLRQIVVCRDLAQRVAAMLEVAGDAPIFSQRMRNALAGGWPQDSDLSRSYQSAGGRVDQQITPDYYRKVLKKLIPGFNPYKIRRRAINEVASKKGATAAAKAANHKDLRMVMRYLDKSPDALRTNLREARQALGREGDARL